MIEHNQTIRSNNSNTSIGNNPLYIQSNDWKTPLDLAIQFGHWEIVSLISDKLQSKIADNLSIKERFIQIKKEFVWEAFR